MAYVSYRDIPNAILDYAFNTLQFYIAENQHTLTHDDIRSAIAFLFTEAQTTDPSLYGFYLLTPKELLSTFLDRCSRDHRLLYQTVSYTIVHRDHPYHAAIRADLPFEPSRITSDTPFNYLIDVMRPLEVYTDEGYHAVDILGQVTIIPGRT